MLISSTNNIFLFYYVAFAEEKPYLFLLKLQYLVHIRDSINVKKKKKLHIL